MKIAHRYGLVPKLDICGGLGIVLGFIFICSLIFWTAQRVVAAL